MTECIAMQPDCPQCVPSPRRAHDTCDDLCRMLAEQLTDAEFHRIWHEPTRCDKCGTVLNDKKGNTFDVPSVCSYETCAVYTCPGCGAPSWGHGPIGCPECSPVGGRFMNRLLGYTRKFKRARREVTS